MQGLNSLTNFNPLSLLGAGGGALPGGLTENDPISSLLALLGNPGAAAQGQPQQPGQVCSCGGGSAEGGAASCGCSCCQKNQDLGF